MTKKRPARKKVSSPFSKNLKAILSERGLSQSAAAVIAQVSPATIHDWIYSSGGGAPSDPMALQRLCRALNCNMEWLLCGSTTPVDSKEISLAELFQSEPDPTFSGIFSIEARRLTRIKKD